MDSDLSFYGVIIKGSDALMYDLDDFLKPFGYSLRELPRENACELWFIVPGNPKVQLDINALLDLVRNRFGNKLQIESDYEYWDFNTEPSIETEEKLEIKKLEEDDD